MTTPPPSGTWLDHALPLLMVLGLVSTPAVEFVGGLNLSLGEQVAWTLVLELGLIVVGLVKGVWTDYWKPRAAGWLNQGIERLLPAYVGYKERYLRHLLDRHRDFDVKGLTRRGIYNLELSQVFVELSLTPQANPTLAKDPVPSAPPATDGGQHEIWYYLDSPALAQQHLALVGSPGSGKTTLLKHIALALASPRPPRAAQGLAHSFPILLFLRDHGQAIGDNPHYTLADAVQERLQRWQRAAPADWWGQRLKQGGCLVLFDGLDEVPEVLRATVVVWVEAQMILYPNNRFLITSRPHGYHKTPLSRVTLLWVRPFTPGQVQRFVHNWYLANEVMASHKEDSGVRMKAQDGAKDLLRRLRNAPTLAELTVNPLLLTMITTVHRYHDKLPGKRVELYAQICEVFLSRRPMKGMDIELTPAQKQSVLEPLAYYMMRNNQLTVGQAEAEAIIQPLLTLVGFQESGATFLTAVEQTSGLLLERESGSYGFAHKTFQEYLAAVHIKQHNLEAELLQQLDNPWWHESIRLYCAQSDATPIVAACLDEARTSVAALALAIECAEEAKLLHEATRIRLAQLLEAGVEAHDPARRQLVAEALLMLRLRRMNRVDESRYLDSTLVTHAEYQLFLNETLLQGKDHYPPHWTTITYPEGCGSQPVIGIRPSDAVAFCEWLTARESSHSWRYRLPNLGERDASIGQGSLSPQQALEVGSWVETEAGVTWVREDERSSSLDHSTKLWEAMGHNLEQMGINELKPFCPPNILETPYINLDTDFEFPLRVASNLGRAHALVRACARTLERNRAHALTHALVRVQARPLNCEVSFSNTLAHALDVEQAFKEMLIRALNITDANTLDFAFDRTLIRLLNLANRLNHELGNKLDHIRSLTQRADLDHGHTHTLILTRARELEIDCTQNLERTPDLVLERARDLILDLNPDDTHDMVYAYAMFVALTIWLADTSKSISQLKAAQVSLRTALQEQMALTVYKEAQFLKTHQGSRRNRMSPDVSQAQERLIQALEFFRTLVILELRIQGTLPAYEGIRLARERIP